jgi:hypothetical protein
MMSAMDEDFSLDTEDEPNEAPTADDEKYLAAEEPEETESEAAKAKAADKEEARLQAIVDRKIADRFMAQPPTPKRVDRQEAPPAPQQTEVDYDKMSDDIVNDLALDPKKAVRKVLELTRQLNTKSGETAAARSNRLVIDNYRADRRDDDSFKAVRDEFDEEVARFTEDQLGKATPAQVRKALSDAEDAVFGRYYRKQIADKKNQAVEPPRYGSGGSSAGGSRVQAGARLSAEQKALVRMGKSAGLSDKDIREMVRGAK